MTANRTGSRPYREIGKPFALRTIELLRALQIVRDSLTAIREGRLYHLVTLSGQLRALVAERRHKPLLMEIAKTLGRQLKVFCMPDVNDSAFPDDLQSQLLFHLAGFPFTLRQQYPAQQQFQFSQSLDREIVFFKGQKYTSRDLIRWYANWAGGSHYSPNLPEDFAQLLSLNASGVEPIANALVQIGEATLTAGRELIKSVVDLEIHALLIVPPQDAAETNYLFDSRFDNSPMRLTVSLNNLLIPRFHVCGLQGIAVRLDADRLIDWSAPRHLQACLRIEDDLATVLELYVDGARVGRMRVPEPLFVLSDPLYYDSYHNRAVDGEPQDFSFGVSQVMMFTSEVGPVHRANVQLFLESKRHDPNQPIMVYAKKSFAHAAPGTKHLTLIGDTPRMRIKDLLPNFAPEPEAPQGDADQV
jgi:hypothetical protein